jgi:hypothetical protein
MTRRFLMNSIVALPLAGVATSSALAADALARCEASQDPDPIFAAIAAHEASLRALSVGLNVMYTLEEELPEELRKSNVDAWEEVIVETDDPRWIESEKNVHALFEADGDAAIGLINVEPAQPWPGWRLSCGTLRSTSGKAIRGRAGYRKMTQSPHRSAKAGSSIFTAILPAS